MAEKMSPEEEGLFRAQMFEYIRSRGAAKIFIRYSGGGDEGGFDEGSWQDKDDNDLADFVAYTDAEDLAEETGASPPKGWSKTYNRELELKMRKWLDAWLYEQYGSFNNEPEVDGSLIIDATLGVITASGSLGFTEYKPFELTL